MPVNTPSRDHDETSEHRQITKHLRAGTQAMRAAGTLFLPQEPKESQTAYQVRLQRSVLTNIYGKTAETFVGRITQKAPLPLDGTPTQIQDIWDDFDNQGNDLQTVIRQALRHGVDDGIVHFLVDSPQAPVLTIETDDGEVPVDRTRADDERLGIRPFVSTIMADNMLEIRKDKAGQITLVRFRTWDERPDPEDEWVTVEIEQIRVLDLQEGRMRLRVFEEESSQQNGQGGSKDKSEWVVKQEILTEFERIPLVSLPISELRPGVGTPLFIDLANLNIRHWQSASDQANIVHVIRVPILFGVGLVDETTQKPQSITIAANSVVHGEAGSSLEYVEHTGKGAEVGQIEIDGLVADMIRMGTEIVLNQRTGTQTATARALDQAEADTLMQAIAAAVESAFAEIFVHLADAFGEPTETDEAGGINLNKDFNITAQDSNVLTQLTQIWQAGGLSLESFWDELKRWGVLSEDFDPDMEADKIEADKDKALEREAQMMELVAESNNAPDDTEEQFEDED